MAFTETQKLTVQLDLAGNFQAKVGAAARAIQGLDKATSHTQQSLSKLGRNIERGIVIGTGAAVAGFVSVAKAAGDFEAQMNTIATIVDRKDIPAIGEQLRKVARDTGIGLDELTSAYYDLASAGVTGALGTEALNDAVKLSIGGLATTKETVDLLTTAINAYGLDAKGAAKATDEFAQAIADGKVTASEIAASFADVASLAKTYSVGIDQIAAAYAFLTAQGVPAAEAMTEMQRAIVSIINPSKDLEKAAKKLGVSFEKDLKTKGVVPTLQEIVAYSQKTGVPLNALLGRVEAVKLALQTSGPQAKGFAAELDRIRKASGTAAAQMAERQKGLNFELARLKANLKDAAITIGSALLPKLTPLVTKLTDLISGNQGKIADFGAKLADEFQKVADAVQKVNWQPFIDGLKLSAQIAQTAISAFRSLPEDLQKLVVAGFALNKVTGGLGTSIVQDIGGVIIDKLAKQRGSSALNPLYVIDVAGGVGGAAGLAEESLAYKVGARIGDVINLSIAGAILANAVPIGKAFASALPDFLKGPGGAGKSDAQLAHERADAATSGVPTGKAADDVVKTPFLALIGTQFKNTLHDALTASGLGKAADDLVDVAKLQKAVVKEFTNAIEKLRHPRNDTERRHAAQELATRVTKGQGDLPRTLAGIAALKAALKATHDPKTAAIIRAALSKVEAKLPGRQYADREIRAAERLLADGKISKADLNKIKALEDSLVHHGLPSAAKKIQDKVDAAQKAITEKERLTTEAIKDKDLSVTVPITNNVTVPISVNGLVKGITFRKSFGDTSSASAGK